MGINGPAFCRSCATLVVFGGNAFLQFQWFAVAQQNFAVCKVAILTRPTRANSWLLGTHVKKWEFASQRFAVFWRSLSFSAQARPLVSMACYHATKFRRSQSRANDVAKWREMTPNSPLFAANSMRF
jgi:hypothetical protein